MGYEGSGRQDDPLFAGERVVGKLGGGLFSARYSISVLLLRSRSLSIYLHNIRCF